MSQSDRNANPLDSEAVKNFQEYLRIPSVQPNVNYDDCVKFLENQAESLDLPIHIYYCAPKKPIVILTWVGQEPNLPSILLNSHMDVVPVFEEKWTKSPFGAEIDAEGNIYARGSQDMKCVGIQYLEAIRRLKLAKVALKRTIHVSFVPDEEIGGVEGMKAFVKTNDFKFLNVGFALDEGVANPSNNFAVFNGERCIWHMIIHCPGTPGHGSILFDNTAGEKVRLILDRFFDFRAKERQKLKANPMAMGDVTTVNLTQLKGGVQPNVVPPELVVVIDCRIAVDVNLEEFEQMINQWCKEAGDDVWIEYPQKDPLLPVTKLDDSNPYWLAFKAAAEKLNILLKPQIFIGGTDSRFVREVGIPAIGFSPMNNTPVLLHAHDEFLNVNVFLQGIDIYCELLSAVANVADITG